MANSSTSASVARSVLPNISHVITVKLDSISLRRCWNKTDTVNRDFKDCVEKDQLVLSCINASISHYALGDTAHRYHTARETWQALEKRFASSHQKYISELRSRLHRTTRAGSPVPETEIIEVVINNVGSRFDNVTSKVRGKPITYDELKALLLKSERGNDDVDACFCKGVLKGCSSCAPGLASGVL
ncbi:hypothetical protein PS1_017016 [Malus domestica]